MKLARSKTIVGSLVGIAVVWAVNQGWIPLEEKDAQAVVDSIELVVLIFLRMALGRAQ